MNNNVKEGFKLSGKLQHDKKVFDSGLEESKSLGGLLALNRLSVPTGQRFGVRHVYAGTVPARVKHHRRAKDKMAKVSRKVNRDH
jgi:hypothetical protein